LSRISDVSIFAFADVKIVKKGGKSNSIYGNFEVAFLFEKF